MKKVLFGLLLAALVLSICGCDDQKPTKWDVEYRHWEIWASGKIVSISKIDNPECEESEGTCGFHPLLDNYVFENGKEVSLHLMRNPGLVIPGQTGKLYKYTGNNSKDCHAWFQWIPNKNIPITPVVKKAEPKPTHAKSKHTHTISKSGPFINVVDTAKPTWIYNSKKNPERYTPVLIKFKNDTISLGYINNINEWKLCINKRQENGGEVIPKNEIIFWKSVDID